MNKNNKNNYLISRLEKTSFLLLVFVLKATAAFSCPGCLIIPGPRFSPIGEFFWISFAWALITLAFYVVSKFLKITLKPKDELNIKRISGLQIVVFGLQIVGFIVLFFLTMGGILILLPIYYFLKYTIIYNRNYKFYAKGNLLQRTFILFQWAMLLIIILNALRMLL